MINKGDLPNGQKMITRNNIQADSDNLCCARKGADAECLKRN